MFNFWLEKFIIKIKKDGKNDNVKNSEINIPPPAIIPSCAKPRKEVKAKLKKPIATAIAVNNKAFAILLFVDSKNSLNSLLEKSQKYKETKEEIQAYYYLSLYHLYIENHLNLLY